MCGVAATQGRSAFVVKGSAVAMIARLSAASAGRMAAAARVVPARQQCRVAARALPAAGQSR
jgi:hypothetical protein